MAVTREDLIQAYNRIGMPNSIAAGLWDGALSTEGDPAAKFGLYYYDNTISEQLIPGGVWTTMMNNGLGARTIKNYGIQGIPDILDAPSGRYKLSGLAKGDGIYIRHTLNIIPQTNGSTYKFRHLVGSAGDGYNLPGWPQAVGEGAGVATGEFVFDTHTFIRGDDALVNGIQPQVYCSNNTILKLTATYVTFTRR